MRRLDSRTPNQIRTMSCALGTLSRADGSAKFSFGQSSVLVAVDGPMEVKIKDEKLDAAVIQVVFDPLVGSSCTQERVLERIIRETFEALILKHLHPRTCIRLTCQVISEDGSLMSTALNAAYLALIDAGIPLNGTLASISCMVDSNGHVLLDPTKFELMNAQSTHEIAMDSQGQIFYIDSVGTFKLNELDQIQELCALAIEQLNAFTRAAIERKIQKEYG